VRVAGREKLDAFMKKHADSRGPLRAWLAEAEGAEWRSSQDGRDRYSSVDFIRDGLAVFNIKGNSYRLVALIGFNRGIVSVQRIGTHAEYNSWTL
jgi:mRNA interferase HigB